MAAISSDLWSLRIIGPACAAASGIQRGAKCAPRGSMCHCCEIRLETLFSVGKTSSMLIRASASWPLMIIQVGGGVSPPGC